MEIFAVGLDLLAVAAYFFSVLDEFLLVLFDFASQTLPGLLAGALFSRFAQILMVLLQFLAIRLPLFSVGFNHYGLIPRSLLRTFLGRVFDTPQLAAG